jgi:DNA-binding CsgD family transcriptional regulator
MKRSTFNETWEKEVPKFREYFENKHMSVSEVAKIYKKSVRQIREVCYRFNINFKQDPLYKWSEEEINVIKTSLANGETFESIAKKLPNKSSSQIIKFYNDYKDKFGLVMGEKQSRSKYKDKIEDIRKLVNDGYTRNEIGEILGINPSTILGIKLKYKMKGPSSQELQDRGIFYLTGGSREIRYETDLTKEKLIKLLESGKSRKEIADMYGLGPRLISTIASRIGWNDKKIEASKEIKRKLILEITGKEATEKDLNKAFIDIFTKEYVEDLLKRNGYCLSRCAENELGGIDPKCLIEAVKKFGIIVPDEIREEIFLAKESCHGYGASKLMPNSMGEYFTEKALENLGLVFEKQLFLDNAVPKDIRPLGVSIDYTVEYS